MYWLTTTTTDPYDDAAGKSNIFSFTNQVADALEKSLDPKRIQNFFLTLENDAKKLNTTIGNGLEANAKNIQNIMQNVYKEGLKYGFAYGDAKEYMDAIATSSQKMISLTSKNVENAIMLGKALGVGAKEVGAMYSSFLQAGMSQETANAKLTEVMQTARKYGVNASTLTKTVADNIYKAQLYGFKSGVDGLKMMAIQAQRVGTSMELAEKAASKAFDPESAIDMASTMQMLGGSVGALADPFQLMNMAQSDMGALQDQILKSSASMVDFNTKTGEFKISPEMRRNMTQFAESMNLSYEEVAKSAVKFRKEQEVMSRIPLTAGMSDADKSVIASMAEIGPGGTIQIKDPNTDKMLDFSQLSTSQVTKLIEEQQELTKGLAKDPKEIAFDQLSVQQKMANTLDEIKQQNIFQFSKENISDLISQTSKLTMYEGFKKDDKTTKQDESAIIMSTEFEKLFQKIKTDAPDLITPSIAAYQAIVTVNTTFIETITAGYTAMVDNAVTVLEAFKDAAGTNNPTMLNDDGTPDGDNNPTTSDDFFLPSNSNTMINAEFGGMMKKIIPNKSDALMGAPNEVFEDLFKLANYGNQVGKILPNKKTMGMETLSQYVEQKIVTENTSNVKLGVEPISVSVKLEGTGLNKDEISKLVDTNEINNAVIERLRGIFDETKLINSIPQLKV